MNARRIGIALGIGWLIMPFIAFAAAIVIWQSDSEFSIASRLFSALLFLPMVLGTALFVAVAVRRFCKLRHGRFLSGALLFFPLLLTTGSAVWLNFLPRRFSPSTVDTTPGDRYFEYAPQTSYGYPCPIYRVFDKKNPDSHYPFIGKTFFDFTSLLGNATFWAFPIYVGVMVAFTKLPKTGEQTDAPKPDLRGLPNG